MSREIIIFGLSGAGKSTMANYIGERYHLRVIHPSGIIRSLLEGKNIQADSSKHNTGFWESQEGVKLFNDRLQQKEVIDFTVDKILVQEIEKGNVVIDSRNLPWLTNKGIRIYLKADNETRAKRVAIRSKISSEQAREIITMKDTKTTELFFNHYGFNIQKDHDVFDKIIDTNKLSEQEVWEILIEYLDKQLLE